MKTNKSVILRLIIIIVVVIILALLLDYFFSSSGEIVSLDQIYQMVEKGEVKAIYLDNYQIFILTNNSTIDIKNFPGQYNYTSYTKSSIVVQQKLTEIFEANPQLMTNIKYTISNPNQVDWTSYILPALSLIAVIFLAFIIVKQVKQQNNQGVLFSKSKARVSENVRIRFSDVAGAEEEKEELLEVVEFLKNPARYSAIGARIPKGILLVGPPGTGKTLFAKAVAGEAGVPFFSISGSDFVEMYVGVGASRVRDLFDQAKKNMPCIIFIDEIDAVGRKRGAGLGGGHDEREQTLNQLLVEMDGFESNTGIIIMAATNRSDILDPALLRPGRFDRQIIVNRPDVRGREAILRVHSRNKPLSPDVDLRTIARITVGFTGADLENLLNEAAILAVRASRNAITMADMSEGINKVIMGPAKKSRLVTETDKRITAFHEAGHAVVASKLPNCDPVHEVTIIPRGMAGGYTMSRPENDNNYITRARLIDDITMGLGGRAAEELTMSTITTGASSDIRNVTQSAHDMVSLWGMSEKLGPVFYGSDGEVFLGNSYQQHKQYSEETSALIDNEASKIISECYNKSKAILKENIKILQNMAHVLLERETIHTEEVNMLINGSTAQEVIAFIDSENARKDSEHRIKKEAVPSTVIAPIDEEVSGSQNENTQQ